MIQSNPFLLRKCMLLPLGVLQITRIVGPNILAPQYRFFPQQWPVQNRAPRGILRM